MFTMTDACPDRRLQHQEKPPLQRFYILPRGAMCLLEVQLFRFQLLGGVTKYQ